MLSETVLSLSRECDRLRERIAELEGRVRRLAADDEADRAQRYLGLSPSEARIFGFMVRRGSADYGLLSEVLYLDGSYPDDIPNSIRAVIKRMRLKVRPRGVDVTTEYGYGFTMSDGARERARHLMGMFEDRDEPGAIRARVRART